MTSRELIRWSRLHDRRSRATHPLVDTLLLGGLCAAWVAWRQTADVEAASTAWFVAAMIWAAVEMMRVPFHVYWRGDAALLAQLPIEGQALFEAALVRCVRAAAIATGSLALGALPLAHAPALFVRHVAFAAVIGATTAFLIPAVVVWTASLVALDGGAGATTALRTATSIVGVSQAARKPQAIAVPDRTASTALLGAVPGAAGSIVLVVLIVARDVLDPAADLGQPILVLAGLVAASVIAIAAVHARAGRAMGTILRDVSALDRQRLAALEIRPPTTIERAIAAVLGDGALPYAKDARLMRRRYPMAFALGALGFLALASVAVMGRIGNPLPWLAGCYAAAGIYGVALARRLRRPPIELARLAATLPISAAARTRAHLAWILGWWLIFVAIPGALAAARQDDRASALAILGAATVVVIGAAVIRTYRPSTGTGTSR